MERKTLTLYQYKPLIEVCGDQNSETKEWHRRLETTLQQTMWLSKMSKLNDPFERHFKMVSNPAAVLQNEALFQHHLDFMNESGISMSTEDFRATLASPEFRMHLNSSNQRWVNKLFGDHGTTCFIRDPANLLMWAHYGNSHRGYCIIFDLDFSAMCKMAGIAPDEEAAYYNGLLSGSEIIPFHYNDNDAHFVFTKVRYSLTPATMRIDDLYPLKDDPYSSTRYLARNAVGVKYKQWEYEDEFRLLGNLNSIDWGLKSFNLPPFIRITGIIMGSEVSDTEQPVFHQLCKKYSRALFQAKCSESDYTILIEPIKDYSLLECA